MKYFVFLFLVGSLVQGAHAEDTTYSTDGYSTYDDIIRELSSNEIRARQATQPDSLDIIKMHAAVGFVSSRLNMKTPDTYKSGQSLSGAEVVFGIDLFSPTWMAEGAVRSYNPETYADTDIQLKEFDLRVAHQDLLRGRLDYRLGAGMSARYLSFGKALGADINQEYTTPASVFFAGLQARLTDQIGVAAEVAYRGSLIDDTVDRGSIDGSLRMTGTF